jgi:hypothetical protein
MAANPLMLLVLRRMVPPTSGPGAGCLLPQVIDCATEYVPDTDRMLFIAQAGAWSAPVGGSATKCLISLMK